ncbi:hypothetical protein QWY85_09145 [Neolewinella lacunae]|uniref:Glycosyl hydrolase family 71 n=1 Tax=Neolewinella lacunae TaxID=1517758 RepID=A0A923TAW4_9BACT|nr:hypothetical protein [Neolewinella lacunae]MBC6996613.1 hypothetical protein [Neolewinella lacunae]MDN3634823.1 hypothetical protein [Neolewinella lacunae]
MMLPFLRFLLCLWPGLLLAQLSSPPQVSPQRADTWAATDALGRSLPDNAATGDLNENKHVGIFYFLWLGAHGHDAHTKPLPDEGVMVPTDTAYRSPYDISRLLAENPANPAYGPDKAFHHWAESVFGYYLSDDDWVIVKHAQLLSDAGVDVIVFDVTNSLVYLPQALRVCTLFARLQQMGWAVPRVAFLTNSQHVKTTERIYAEFYAPGLYPDLWFRWKGKPLLMGNPEGLSPEIQEFFNFRRSWAWTKGQEWFGDGKDKWPWIDHYPQQYGWHDSPGVPEQIVVASAQHPVSNIGRSFHAGRQPAPDSIDPGRGLFFAEQWRRAWEVDPEFVFITGWNEWVAMRFTDGRAKQIMGKPVQPGDTYFVDQYNEEFSRDIEPMRGGFTDNYYYQMVDGIRRYKGTRPPQQRPGQTAAMTIDGSFTEWESVTGVYYDHLADTRHRAHPGWGRTGVYRDSSGRYDLVEARAAEGADHFFFYLRSHNDFAAGQVPEGLELLLVAGAAEMPASLGYHYRVVRGAAAGAMEVQRSRGGWEWTSIGQAAVALRGNQLELSLPKALLGDYPPVLEFKWIDNVYPAGDALRFYTHGDAAPNARFNYRFQTAKTDDR